jgi:hypothetical protein
VTTARPSEHDDRAAVTAFLDALEHPLKALMETIRATILSADRSITEGIKWNTASFYSSGWFATINVRAKSGVQLILHHGAKIRKGGKTGSAIKDPSHLLTWLGDDRASITFSGPEDFQSKRAAFTNLIKDWVKCQPRGE